jgi:hypothetical protein
MTSTIGNHRLASLALALVVVACGGEGGGDGSGTAPPPDAGSILGSAATSYAEANDAGNSSEAGSEVTGYTLDVDGLRITGTFAATGTTYDYYRFNTGAYRYVDVQAFVNGVKQDAQNYESTVTLNAFVNDGYSTLTGHAYFVNAWMSGTDRDYVIGISGTPGASYTLELKAH